VARGTKAQPQATEDLWHLGIDDLFASTTASAAGGVAGPFVITLTLASVPSGAMPRAMPRFERLCVYQLQHAVDEQRQEFRLCLGIIETELEADAILAAVREHYPAARKETASEADTRAVALRMARAAQRAAAKRTEPRRPRPAKSPKPQQQKAQPQAQKPHGKKASGGSKRDAKARADVTPPAPAQPAAPPEWNLDDVLPEFAGHAAVKCAPVAPLNAAPRAAAPVVTAPPAVEPAMIEFTVEAPIAAEPVTVVPVQYDFDSDADSDAVTTELEALTFTIDAPLPGIVPPPPAADLEITIEAVAPVELTLQAPVPVPAVAPSAPPQPEIEITVEAPHIIDAAVTESAPSIEIVSFSEASSPTEVAIEAATLSLAPPSVEVPTLSEPPTLEVAPLAIDSTQTQRALTPLELAAGDTASRWFVVQLILSEHEIDPEQVPSLDIFTEYRLYRVKGLDKGNVMNALRLGFFGSEPAAQAVAGYLAVYFDAPTITRVSVAERERFADDRLAACKDIGESGTHSVIELTSPAPLPKRAARAVVQPEKDTRTSGSLWSRLVAPLKR
jgi:hypothetical protein